jgi:hypothetical protein
MRPRLVVLDVVLYGAALVSTLLITPHGAGAQPVTVEEVLTKAATYVQTFVGRFANVVAEERYLQETMSTSTTRAGARRELKSDFLLVQLPGSPMFMPFRDVFEVDGSLVRDREQRVAKLLLEQSPGALQRANQIAQESARYNLDSNNIKRTMNDPLFAIGFLQPENQIRFRYELDGRDRSSGTNIWIVKYREQSRPTFIKGAYDKDMPARGRYWIDASDGRVVKTELVLEDYAISATLTTEFTLDDRFRIDVPVRMNERYRLTTGREVSGVATYGRFRRFDVSTDEAIQNPR